MRAVQRAKSLLKARAACTRLLLNERVIPNLCTSKRTRLAAIFIDESGNIADSPLFSLGAFIALSDSPDQLDKISCELEFHDNWGFSRTNYKPPRQDPWSDSIAWTTEVLRQVPGSFLPKNKPRSWNWSQYRQLIDEVLKALNAQFTRHGIQWAAAAFTYQLDAPYASSSGTGNLGSIVDHDMLYRQGLRDLLRFSFEHYPLIRSVLERPDARLQVHVAVRELRSNAFADPDYRRDMETRFGTRFRKLRNGYALETLKGSDVFPLVAGVCAELGIPISGLDSACGVILHDYESVQVDPSRMAVPETLPLQIHYLATGLRSPPAGTIPTDQKRCRRGSIGGSFRNGTGISTSYGRPVRQFVSLAWGRKQLTGCANCGSPAPMI